MTSPKKFNIPLLEEGTLFHFGYIAEGATRWPEDKDFLPVTDSAGNIIGKASNMTRNGNQVYVEIEFAPQTVSNPEATSEDEPLTQVPSPYEKVIEQQMIDLSAFSKGVIKRPLTEDEKDALSATSYAQKVTDCLLTEFRAGIDPGFPPHLLEPKSVRRLDTE